FEAALDSIQPNFPPAILQGDPRFSNKYYNMSKGEEFRGPWNEGTSTQLGEEWKYVDDPLQNVRETNGLTEEPIEGTERTEAEIQNLNKALSDERSSEIDQATPKKDMQWSDYKI